MSHICPSGPARSQFARVQHSVARAHAGMQALLEHVVQHSTALEVNEMNAIDENEDGNGTASKSRVVRAALAGSGY